MQHCSIFMLTTRMKCNTHCMVNVHLYNNSQNDKVIDVITLTSNKSLPSDNEILPDSTSNTLSEYIILSQLWLNIFIRGSCPSVLVYKICHICSRGLIRYTVNTHSSADPSAMPRVVNNSTIHSTMPCDQNKAQRYTLYCFVLFVLYCVVCIALIEGQI
jgi:hypothetical protein